MWFKNLVPYSLTGNFTGNLPSNFTGDRLQATATIEQQLAAYSFTPCGRQDSSALGWVSPLRAMQEMPLVHTVAGHLLLCARKEEKILPTSVINQELQTYLTQLAKQSPLPVNKAKKQALREQIISDLLPRAFSKFQDTHVWINTHAALLIIDAASVKKAEEILALLRKSLGSLAVAPWMREAPVTAMLTQWVRSEVLPAGFVLREEAELRSTQAEGGTIRCKNQSLISEEIAAHLAADKVVTKLALDWQTRVQFLLTEEGLLKRLKFAEVLQQQNSDIDRNEALQRLDADFVLATGELARLLQALQASVGVPTLPSELSSESPQDAQSGL